jgi:exodeoxyribonuclease VII large subunit
LPFGRAADTIGLPTVSAHGPQTPPTDCPPPRADCRLPTADRPMSLDHSLDYLYGGGIGAAIGVGQLTRHLTALIHEDVILQDLWVRGELSNVTRAASGHVYFSLKDEAACVGGVMWRSAAGRLAFRPEAGMQVLAHGAVDVYAPRGQYQLVVDELQPDGLGSLHLAFEQTKARLLAEGLFDEERKRPLPAFPRRVAVVTSLQGAAVRDICAVLSESEFPPEVLLIGALVQGAGAEESVCAALRLANEASDADLVVVARGGGSLEDLWAFNTEPIARAIAASRLPVISAVGHETDVTLADLAADFRAPTPTAAAEEIAARRSGMARRATYAVARALDLFRGRVRTAELSLSALSRRPPLARPMSMVESRRQRLDEVIARLLRAREVCFTGHRHRLALAASKLGGLSPLETLARGYALVRKLPEETPVHSVSQVAEGDTVRVQLADGRIEAQVRRVEPKEEP